MEITVTNQGDQASIQIEGLIDEEGAEKLKTTLTGLNMSAIKTVILDMGKVTHIGSSGIGKLLLFYKNISVYGGKLRVVNLPGTIYELFRELKLDTLFHVAKR